MENNEFLSVPELARVTCEAESTWRKRIWLRRISFVKLGRTVRVRREDFQRWVAERVVPAAPAERRPKEGRP